MTVGRDVNIIGTETSVPEQRKKVIVTDSGNTFALCFLRQDKNPFNPQYLLGHSDFKTVNHYVSTLGMEDTLKAYEQACPSAPICSRF